MKNNDYDFTSAQSRLASRQAQNQVSRAPTRNIRMTGVKMNRTTQSGFNKNSERLMKAQNRLRSQKKPKNEDPEKRMAQFESEIHELMDACAMEEVTIYLFIYIFVYIYMYYVP